MSRATEAGVALSMAMLRHDPLCAGDNRFSDDTTRPDHVRELCIMCPLYDQCHAYALAARPQGGIWAGRRWDHSPRTKKATA